MYIHQLEKKAIMEEIGSTGLKQLSGRVYEEFLNALARDGNDFTIYEEMDNNDPIIGAMLFSINNLLKSADWKTIPADSEDQEAIEIAEFFDHIKDEMDHTWLDFIDEVLTFLVYGFAPIEIVYDIIQEDKYYGRIKWKKLTLRSQNTVERWYFGKNGDIEGFEQWDSYNNIRVNIPWEKFLLFRTESRKNNPQGKSILRKAYVPWYYKKNIQRIETIAIERDLAGLPVAKIPQAYMSSGATSQQKSIFEEVKKIIRNIRNDEQSGIVFPSDVDPANGNELFKIELLSSGGKKQIDTDRIVTRYSKEILFTTLSDFIMLGQDKIGSQALGSEKTKIFKEALRTWLSKIEQVLNRYAIPRLMKLNGMSLDKAPKYKADKIYQIDLDRWVKSLTELVKSGVMVPEEFENLEEHIKEKLDIE